MHTSTQACFRRAQGQPDDVNLVLGFRVLMLSTCTAVYLGHAGADEEAEGGGVEDDEHAGQEVRDKGNRGIGEDVGVDI